MLVIFGAGLAALAAQNIFKGFTENLGREWARLAVERRQSARRAVEARRVAKRGGGPLDVLASSNEPSVEVALQELLIQVAPTPRAAALLNSIQAGPAELKGSTAVVLGIGRGVTEEIQALMSGTGRRIASLAFAVDDNSTASPTPDVVRFQGDLWQQLSLAMRAADDAIRARTGNLLAVILKTPITGAWITDAAFDLDRLMSSLFDNTARTTWLTYVEPEDSTAWPKDIVLELPVPSHILVRALRNLSVPSPWALRATRDRRIVLSSDPNPRVRGATRLRG